MTNKNRPMEKLMHKTVQHRKWVFKAYNPFTVKEQSLWAFILTFLGLHIVTYKTMNKVKEAIPEFLFGFISTLYTGGDLKWKEEYINTTVNEGLDDIISNYWKGSTYTAQHYIGLTDGTPSFASGDTMSSHAGWTEITDYSEANRQDLTANLGAVSGQQVTTSTSLSFSINASATVGGGFITTDNTKGGSTGTLIGGGAFSGGNRSLQNNDTLNVDVTITEASA